MSRTFRNVLAAVVLTTLLIGLPSAYAALKVWSGSESIQTADLNSNFTQVNNAATALVTNAKVSASAAVASSKLAAYRQIPTDWVHMTQASSSCGTSAAGCTVTSPSGMVVSGIATGKYTVGFASPKVDITYGVTISVETVTGTHGQCVRYPLSSTTSQFIVWCYNDATTLTDTGFTIVILDNN
jgi:hypothetical protein